MTVYGFVRVSTGSQDAQSQERDIRKVSADAVIIRPDTRAASASKGEQLDALDAVIAKLREGDRVIVTDSSRLDRRDNLTSQVETMLAIRKTGAVIVSLAPGEETFANGDDLGSWVTTLVRQNANAQKSRTVRSHTWRGVQSIRDNNAHHGALPMFWSREGKQYEKQAYCADPRAVNDVYTRVADGESIASVARLYGVYPEVIKTLIRTEANHTGVFHCSYTSEGETHQWSHQATPVVESELWWRANRRLAVNKTPARVSKGGRPVARPSNWLSGVLPCPGCGQRLYVNAGPTAAGNPRTAKLRCAGNSKNRLACGNFKGIDADVVARAVDDLFRAEKTTQLLSYQRVAGNAHELDGLRAKLAKIQARLSITEDDDELDTLVAERKSLKARIEGFEVVPDSFDYAPAGQTVAGMWDAATTDTKRAMALALRRSLGMKLEITPTGFSFLFSPAGASGSASASGVVDLGKGLCFRRLAA